MLEVVTGAKEGAVSEVPEPVVATSVVVGEVVVTVTLGATMVVEVSEAVVICVAVEERRDVSASVAV